MSIQKVRAKTDPFGAALGVLTFLAGVALLGLTFYAAYRMFAVPPRQAMEIEPGKAVDLAKTGDSFIRLLERVILLVVMGAVASALSNRGIKLYAASRVCIIHDEQASKEPGS